MARSLKRGSIVGTDPRGSNLLRPKTSWVRYGSVLLGGNSPNGSFMRRLGVMLTLVLGSTGLLPAQEFRGTISGQVMDASGAAIVGATVRAVQRSTNQATGAITNQDGYYVLPYLQPSGYDVEVSANGFHKMKKENVTLL